MKASDLVGTWHLLRYEQAAPDGTVILPMGERAFGRLTYSADGYMHALLAPGDRKAFASNDVYGGNLEEKLAAADRFVAYCGRYEVRDGVVIHHAEGSFFPNWVGEELPRQATLAGDHLTLSAPTAKRGGVSGEARLIWVRRGRHERG
jgi:hypothetical protein